MDLISKAIRNLEQTIYLPVVKSILTFSIIPWERRTTCLLLKYGCVPPGEPSINRARWYLPDDKTEDISFLYFKH